MSSKRLGRIRQEMARLGLDGLLVSSLQDIRYLSGFSGSTALALITQSRAALILDFRYLTQAAREVSHFEIVTTPTKPWDAVANLAQDWKIQRLGFEAEDLSFFQHEKLKEGLPDVTLVATSELIKDLRMVKDSEEVTLIQKSAEILSITLEEVLSEIKPGLREREVAALLEYRMKIHGADREGFDTIVASGERSAMPHGIASDKELIKGELVIIDCGCGYQGYNADITRTIALGKPSARALEIYQVVLRAQEQALATARVGVRAATVDKAARQVIEGEGYGEFFGHNTGHGVGLSVHEKPTLSRDSEIPLEEGMTFTIEPGIYLPGVGGIRIEDTVTLGLRGLEVLTSAPRELLIL